MGRGRELCGADLTFATEPAAGDPALADAFGKQREKHVLISSAWAGRRDYLRRQGRIAINRDFVGFSQKKILSRSPISSVVYKRKMMAFLQHVDFNATGL